MPLGCSSAAGEPRQTVGRSTARLLTVLGLLMIPDWVSGDPLLLATARYIGGGGTSAASYRDVVAVSFELGSTGALPGAPCALHRLGCEPIPLSQILPGGVFEFDSTHGMYFSEVTGLLTNGVSDPLWGITRLFNVADELLFASGSGGPDSTTLQRSPDISGHIDLIRLRVLDWTLGEDCCSPNGLSYSADVVWEFYGSTADGGPVVDVIFPHAGTVLGVGSTATIVWDARDDEEVTAIDLALSRDRGATYQPIISGLPNTGTYDWIVTGPPHDNQGRPVFDSYILVTAYDAAGHFMSNRGGRFAIVDPSTPVRAPELHAEVVSGGIELRWYFSLAIPVEEVTLERSRWETGPWAPVRSEVRRDGEVSVVLDSDVSPGLLYYYRLVARYADGSRMVDGPVEIRAGFSGQALLAVVPNPVRGLLEVEFSLDRGERVRLDVLDVQGREVATLGDAYYPPGRHRVPWNGKGVTGSTSPGIYFIRFAGEGRSSMRRVVRVE